MAAGSISDLLTMWVDMRSVGLEIMSLESLTDFVASLRRNWSETAANTLTKMGVFRSLVAFYPHATYSAANVLADVFHIALSSASVRNSLSACGFGDVIAARLRAHKSSLVEVTRGACIIAAITRYSPPLSSALLPADYDEIVTIISSSLYVHGAASHPVLSETQWSSGCESVASLGIDSPTDTQSVAGKHPHPQWQDLATLSPLHLRAYLWIALLFISFRQLHVHKSVSAASDLDVYLFCVGTDEPVPAWVRSGFASLFSSISDGDAQAHPSARAALLRWLRRGSRRALFERALSKGTFEAAEVLRGVYELISELPESDPPMPVVSMGLASAASLRGLHSMISTADNEKYPQLQLHTLLFDHMLQYAIAVEPVLAAEAIATSNALVGVKARLGMATNAAALVRHASYYACLTYALVCSPVPHALAHIVATGVLESAVELTGDALFLSQGLHGPRLMETAPGHAVVLASQRLLPALKVLAAAAKGQRYVDAVTDGGKDVACICEPQCGGPAVSWAVIANVCPGGAASATHLRRRLTKTMTRVLSSGTFVVDVNNVLAVASLPSMVSASLDGEPFADISRRPSPAGPLSPQIVSITTDMSAAIRLACPAVEAVAVVRGGVPYAQWKAM